MADIPTQNFDLYADRRERIAAMIARRNFIVRPGNRGQKPIDLTGKKFGRLFIVSLASKKPEYRYVCACDCGNITTVYGKNLRNGHHITCGCRQPRHNMSGTPIYKVWVSMNGRCRSRKITAAEESLFAMNGEKAFRLSLNGRWRMVTGKASI